MKYFKNTSWLFTEKVLRMFVGLFVGVWVARYLGPTKYGLLSYAQSFVSLFLLFSTLGLDSIIVRELVKDESQRDVLLGTGFALKLLGSIFVLSFLLVGLRFTANDMFTNKLILTIAFGLIFQSFNVIDFYFQSIVMSKFVVSVNIFFFFVSSIIKFVLIIYKAPLIAFAFVIVLDSFFVALGYIFIYVHKNLSFRRWSFNYGKAKQLLWESFPLILAGAVNSVYMRIDQVMIKDMLGLADVGNYSVAVKLTEVWFGIGVVFCNSIFPAIVKAKEVSRAFFHNRLYQLLRMLNVLSYSLSIVVFLFSDRIILLLFGNRYLAASSVLTVHIFSTIFVYMGVVSGRWLIAEGKVKLNLYRNILGLLTNVSLNYILISRMGIVGAAIASLLSYIAAFYIFDIFRQDTRDIFWLKTKSAILLRSKI